MYETEIEQIQKRIADIKRITDLTQREINTILEQNDDVEKSKRMIAERKETISKMESHEEKLNTVLAILLKHEKTISHFVDSGSKSKEGLSKSSV